MSKEKTNSSAATPNASAAAAPAPEVNAPVVSGWLVEGKVMSDAEYNEWFQKKVAAANAPQPTPGN